MKVLLIDPPYDRLVGFRSEWFPLGLTYIASYLQLSGHEVGIYNAEHGCDTKYKSIVSYAEDFSKYKSAINSDQHPVWQEAREKIRSFNPQLVGISAITPKVPAALKIAQICKDINHDTTVVFGGHHSTIRPDEILSTQNVDFVIRGEGEESLCELIEKLQNPLPNYHTVEGLSFRNNGEIIHNANRKYINDLDSLPLPARNRLFDLQSYTPVQLSMVMTSRGCPYQCGFCSSRNMWGKSIRFRSINNVLKEISELKTRYSVNNITFMDDSFTLNRNRVKDFCMALIESRINITWSCLTRVNIISDELIMLMKKAGCTKIDVGIESGNQRVLDLIKKEITLKQVQEAVKILRKNKMYWSGFFMFGFPTETEEDIFDTLDFLKQTNPDWANISIFTPYPKTELYELSVEKGMITDPPDYTLYSHQNPNLRFTDKIPQDRFYSLAKHVLKEIHKHNSSCKSLIKRALTRKYHKNPRLLLHDARKVMTWLKKTNSRPPTIKEIQNHTAQNNSRSESISNAAQSSGPD